jgi:hypothetical protein
MLCRTGCKKGGIELPFDKVSKSPAAYVLALSAIIDEGGGLIRPGRYSGRDLCERGPASCARPFPKTWSSHQRATACR